MIKNPIALSRLWLSLTCLLGVLAFTWPLYLPINSLVFLSGDNARWSAVLVAFLGISIFLFDIKKGLIDSRAVALLGILTALVASLRMVGAGAIGIEPIWFLIILSARVFGANFGFCLGSLAIGISALITGGIGPWLPFQMLAAGWVGMGAGLLPRKFSGRKEIILLIIYGIFASLLFGLFMDLQFWPWLAGSDTQLSFIAGDSIFHNLHKFLTFHFASAMAWDIPRAITTSLLIAISAKAVLGALRRSQIKISLGRGFNERVMARKEI